MNAAACFSAVEGRRHLFRFGGMSAAAPARVFEGHKLEQIPTHGNSRLRVAGAGLYTGTLDVSYLKFCSAAYAVSANPRDYVIIDLPIVEADVPNRNMDAFPYVELVSWNAVAKQPVWRTFTWAPTFENHQNGDPKAAKGVIFDSILRREGNRWITRVLAGFDRTKDPRMVKEILEAKTNAFSMGALAAFLSCSCHGFVYDGNPANGCEFIRAGRLGDIASIPGRGEVLIHNSCHGVNFVETSRVKDPAFFGAQSDLVLSIPA